MNAKHNLSEVIAGLIQFLRTKKYKENSIRKYINTWENLRNFMIRLEIPFYSRDIGDAFIKDCFGDIPYHDLKKIQKAKVRHVQALSESHETGAIKVKRTRVPEVAFADKLGEPFKEFIEHSMAIKRSERTIRLNKKQINTLYLDLLQCSKGIADISASYMVQYLLRLDETHKEFSRNNIIKTIRVFFRYLCAEGLLQNNQEQYWMSIMKPRDVRQPKIPSVYSREEVERLINAVDRGNPQGKRDYAMILLAARYGLRVSDITGLRYCNLDWVNNRIVLVQQKTGEKVEMPLSEEVGNAIIEYLKFGRPEVNEPYLFISANAPYSRLQGRGMTIAIARSMRQADIGFEERKHGPHALRHSLASNLLGLNEPLPVISEILGHSNTQSTMCYLRVDFNQLKQCALEVPCVPSSFYDNLYE
ncbi:MAG: tyrosine-type recombinase/integrase [Ferruginibacter sp.]